MPGSCVLSETGISEGSARDVSCTAQRSMVADRGKLRPSGRRERQSRDREDSLTDQSGARRPRQMTAQRPPDSYCSGPVARAIRVRTWSRSIHLRSSAAIIRAMPKRGPNSAQIKRVSLVARSITLRLWRSVM